MQHVVRVCQRQLRYLYAEWVSWISHLMYWTYELRTAVLLITNVITNSIVLFGVVVQNVEYTAYCKDSIVVQLVLWLWQCSVFV